jgi:hypothetical protein
MKKIIKERGMGKTTECVRLAAQKGIRIICMNENNKNHILDVANELGVGIPEPLTIEQISSPRYRNMKLSEVIVDDAEYILQTLLALKVCAVAFTKPSEITMQEIGKMIGKNIDDIEIID